MVSVAPKLRIPRQARSRETLRRILDAFEEALRDKTFEEVTVGELCERADCSVGTFYGRVESKDALLEHLRRRVYGEVETRLGELFDPQRGAKTDLESVISEQLEVLLDFHLLRRGVIRAVVIQARRHPAFAEQTQLFNGTVLRLVRESWLSHRGEITAPDPVFAAEQASIMIAGYFREAIVFRELWPTERPFDREALFQHCKVATIRSLMGRDPERSSS
ncbi:MAG: TetR/AcrR family transcriptional regulator [Nannocystaceae bacterium]|nr:TetR/AcrR family transcriptional regulator [Nannocystaceae bacterium]